MTVQTKIKRFISILITLLMTVAFISSSNIAFAGDDFGNNAIRESKESDLDMSEEEWEKIGERFKDELKRESGNDSRSQNPAQKSSLKGPKSKAAKIAAKKMLKKLTHMGKAPYTRALKKAVGILPKKNQKAVLKVLKYENVKEALNFAANLEGTITNAAEKGLNRIGVKGKVAYYGAKVIVFILF